MTVRAAGLGALGLSLAALALGCAGAPGLRIDLHEPAVVPAHVFPRVFLRSDGSGDAEALARAIAADLRARGMDAIELASGASAGSLLTEHDGAALLVEVSVVRSQTIEARHFTETTSLCAPACSSVPVERLRDVTVLRARAELVMRDARTEEEFAREALERHEDEVDMGASGRLYDRLARATLELFRGARSSREVDLRPLASAEGRAALDDARAGRVGAAVTALRALAEHAAELPLEERVAVHYDLGQVLRVAALDEGADLDAEARAALEEAMHLRPDARTGAALEALAEESALRARARAEDAAYHRNREPAPPVAPPSYE